MDIQGPDRAKEFIGELTEAVGQDCDRPIVLDLGRVRYLSSMGYSALFKMVKCARERQRPVKFCNIHEDVRVGAEAVGLPQVVEILRERGRGARRPSRGPEPRRDGTRVRGSGSLHLRARPTGFSEGAGTT